MHGDEVTCHKLQISKLQDGGRPPSWNSLSWHIATKNHPILMKFGSEEQTTVTWPNMNIFKNKFKMADGRYYWQMTIVFGHNSAADCRCQWKFAWKSSFFFRISATATRVPHERISCWEIIHDVIVERLVNHVTVQVCMCSGCRFSVAVTRWTWSA